MRIAHLIENIVSLVLYIISLIIFIITFDSFIRRADTSMGVGLSVNLYAILGGSLICQFIFMLKYGCYRYYNFFNIFVVTVSAFLASYYFWDFYPASIFHIIIGALNLVFPIISLSYYKIVTKNSPRQGEAK